MLQQSRTVSGCQQQPKLKALLGFAVVVVDDKDILPGNRAMCRPTGLLCKQELCMSCSRVTEQG